MTEKKTFRKASLQQVRQAGIYFSVAELNKRGVSATPVKKKSKIVIIADNHDKSRSITLRVKSKQVSLAVEYYGWSTDDAQI